MIDQLHTNLIFNAHVDPAPGLYRAYVYRDEVTGEQIIGGVYKTAVGIDRERFAYSNNSFYPQRKLRRIALLNITVKPRTDITNV